MRILESLLKSKLFILLLLTLPLVFIVIGGFTGGFDANPVEYITLETGEVAMVLLLITLWLSPLKLFFPKSTLIKILMRHRRMMGVSCFVYVLCHFIIYYLGSDDLNAVLEDLTRPFILSGGVAFLLLFLLAMTSTNWAIKRMGAKKWKVLHRFVYLCALLVFLHMFIKEKSNVLETILWFAPLVLAESYRLYKVKFSMRFSTAS